MPGDRLYAPNAAAWRRWLIRHHNSSSEIWLEFPKKHTGKPCASYEDALDEALCYGWIDSIVKRLDDNTYLRKFTPRTNAAKWSPKNLNRMRELIAQERVTAPGLAVLGVPLERAPVASAAKPAAPPGFPEFVREAIEKNPKAAAFWATLAPSYRRRYLGWITAAKKEESRRARLARVIGFLEENRKSVLV
jgi:uncharacterized protein YdeI (YjbR/CyaY-like superfamily)